LKETATNNEGKPVCRYRLSPGTYDALPCTRAFFTDRGDLLKCRLQRDLLSLHSFRERQTHILFHDSLSLRRSDTKERLLVILSCSFPVVLGYWDDGKDNVQTDVKEMGWEGVNWINLAEKRDK